MRQADRETIAGGSFSRISRSIGGRRPSLIVLETGRCFRRSCRRRSPPNRRQSARNRCVKPRAPACFDDPLGRGQPGSLAAPGAGAAPEVRESAYRADAAASEIRRVRLLRSLVPGVEAAGGGTEADLQRGAMAENEASVCGGAAAGEGAGGRGLSAGGRRGTGGEQAAQRADRRAGRPAKPSR